MDGVGLILLTLGSRERNGSRRKSTMGWVFTSAWLRYNWFLSKASKAIFPNRFSSLAHHSTGSSSVRKIPHFAKYLLRAQDTSSSYILVLFEGNTPFVSSQRRHNNAVLSGPVQFSYHFVSKAFIHISAEILLNATFNVLLSVANNFKKRITISSYFHSSFMPSC